MGTAREAGERGRACADQLCPHPSCFLRDLKSKVITFMAASFTIAQTQKQPRCPSVGKWINQLWYVHGGLLFSPKKK